MQNYLLTLAYDGTNYCGLQVQPNGRSVAQTFQDCLLYTSAPPLGELLSNAKLRGRARLPLLFLSLIHI